MEQEITSNSPDWFYLVLLGLVVLVLAARLVSLPRFLALVKFPLSPSNNEQKLLQAQKGQGLSFEILTSILGYISFALVIFLTLQKSSGDDVWNLFFFLKLLLVFSLFFLGKAAVGQGVSWVFGQDNLVTAAQRSAIFARAWLGVISIPLLALAAYAVFPTLILKWILGILAAFAVYFSIHISIKWLWKMSAPAYYKFFYICALEIMPFTLLGIWLQRLVK